MSTSSYACCSCGAIEEIPIDILEYFDETNPQQLVFGGHQFRCESCDSGIMKPVNDTNPLIMGLGLFEGFKGF